MLTSYTDVQTGEETEDNTQSQEIYIKRSLLKDRPYTRFFVKENINTDIYIYHE